MRAYSTTADQQAPKAAPAVKPTATPTITAAPAAAPAAARKPAASSSSGPSKTLASSPSDPVKYRYSNEEAMAKAQDMIPAEFHTKLADGAWKIRLEAAEEMIRWAEENADKGEVESEVVFRFLGKVPGWGEKNFQVCAMSVLMDVPAIPDRSRCRVYTADSDRYLPSYTTSCVLWPTNHPHSASPLLRWRLGHCQRSWAI